MLFQIITATVRVQEILNFCRINSAWLKSIEILLKGCASNEEAIYFNIVADDNDSIYSLR